jgi:molybdenum cofactor biosynthesis enzyme MoaA
MNMHTAVSQDYERILINIVRVLPPNRAEQLVDFARFLEAQTLAQELIQEEYISEIEADNARWDTLLATDEAQASLEKLADEALAEQRAGKTKPMTFNDEGQIAPG